MNPKKNHKFTKGPWYHIGSLIEVESATKPDICTLDLKAMDQAHLFRSEEEEMANGRLIAAAPDLVHALGEMLSLLELVGIAHPAITHDHEAINDALRTYEAATGSAFK
jgi:hypothetical protein